MLPGAYQNLIYKELKEIFLEIQGKILLNREVLNSDFEGIIEQEKA